MIWRQLESTPIDIDTGIAPAMSLLIGATLAAHAVPLLVSRDGRIEPAASGVFYRLGERLLLVTCRHLFDDGVVIGDLGIALPTQGRVSWLRHARARVLVHPERDLAVILIGAADVAHEFRRQWPVLPLAGEPEAQAPALALVLAAYPFAQMRRVDAVLHARPVVVFARLLEQGDDVRATYARTAVRADLSVGGAHWRTYSTLTLPPDSAGQWIVEARTADNQLLARDEFVCVSARDGT